VKRAARLEFTACFLELYAAAEHLHDIGSRDQIVNEVLWYQAAHNMINGYSGLAGLVPTLLLLLS
jgi:hypothetical protein